MKKNGYIDTLRQITIPVNMIPDNNIGPFKWLSDEIYAGKATIKSNSVQFVIVKILNPQRRAYNFKTRSSFDVYIIGDFRATFTPVLRVAEAFATFYLEMGVLPNIIPIPKHILKKDKEIMYKLKNGVMLYERR